MTRTIGRGHRIGATHVPPKSRRVDPAHRAKVVANALELRALLAGAETEDGFLEWIIDYARAHAWLAYHVRNSKRGIVQGDTGFPDLVLTDGDLTLFVEVKSEKGGLDQAQARWALTLTRACQLWDLWRPSDRPRVEAILGHKRRPGFMIPGEVEVFARKAMPAELAGIVSRAVERSRSVDGQPPVR